MKWPDDWTSSIRREMPIGSLTTLKVGGVAAYAFFPRDERDLAAQLRWCHEEGLPVRVLGHGSNVLVGDERFAGAVVCMRGLKGLRVDGTRVTARAGSSLPNVIAKTLAQGLTGLETLVGIPASLGGAVRMNAGGRYGSVSDRLVRVRGVALDTGRVIERSREQCAFGYRRSNLDRLVVTEATFELEPGDATAAKTRARDIFTEKRAAQPLREATAGCVFKNPPGESAGRLVEAAGLKGVREGGAEVSPHHANFIVTGPDARARHVRTLIDRMRSAVVERSGHELELEIEVWS